MPLDWTHDVTRADYHLKDLETFGERLEAAVNRACPSSPSRYKEVHALLLSWQDDDLGVNREIAELKTTFDQIYRFDVEEWRIPSEHAPKALRTRITNFLNAYEDENNLLIVYYGGRTHLETLSKDQTPNKRR